jgi:hypothetical protein
MQEGSLTKKKKKKTAKHLAFYLPVPSILYCFKHLLSVKGFSPWQGTLPSAQQP